MYLGVVTCTCLFWVVKCLLGGQGGEAVTCTFLFGVFACFLEGFLRLKVYLGVVTYTMGL